MALGAWGLTIIFLKGSGPNPILRRLGALLAAIGLAGIIEARRTLGESFSIAPRARTLVTNGIYSKLRNPIYVCGELLLLGVALMMQKRYFYLFLLIAIPIQMLRARSEARVLEEKFGDEYRAYRRRTWF